VRELMALCPALLRAREREGRPSFWERPSLALPDREIPPRGEAHPKPNACGLVKIIDVVQNH
jgi:hypothetical protein